MDSLERSIRNIKLAIVFVVIAIICSLATLVVTVVRADAHPGPRRSAQHHHHPSFTPKACPVTPRGAVPGQFPIGALRNFPAFLAGAQPYAIQLGREDNTGLGRKQPPAMPQPKVGQLWTLTRLHLDLNSLVTYLNPAEPVPTVVEYTLKLNLSGVVVWSEQIAQALKPSQFHPTENFVGQQTLITDFVNPIPYLSGQQLIFEVTGIIPDTTLHTKATVVTEIGKVTLENTAVQYATEATGKSVIDYVETAA